MLWFLAACQPTPVGDALPSPAPVVDPAVIDDPLDEEPPVEEPPPTPTGIAPDFTLEIQGGDSFTLSDHAGDVILVDISGFT